VHLAYNVDHPRYAVSGVWHVYLKGDGIYRQNGTRVGTIGAPIDPRAGDPVYPATGGGSWVWDIDVRRGRPEIVYATFPSPLTRHTYRYARFDGRRWRDRYLAEAGGPFTPDPTQIWYSAGIDLDDGTIWVTRPIGGQFELERWNDHRQITRNSPVPNARPFGIAGGVLWMRGNYPTFRTFQTGIKWWHPDSKRLCHRLLTHWRSEHSRRSLRAYQGGC
jgi:hypothetical protein